MIRSAVLFAVVFVTAGCAGGQGDRAAVDGDCDAELVWNGVAYGGVAASAPPELGRRLGTATVPECGPSMPERRVKVMAVRGVPPPVALVSPGLDRELVWLGPGYLASSPEHPLHDAVESAVGGWDAERGYKCEAARAVRGEARRTPGALHGYLEVTAPDEAEQTFLLERDVRGIVTLDDETVATGFERHGIPFIQAGDAFELTVSECEGKESEPGLAGLRRLVVREIRLARAGG